MRPITKQQQQLEAIAKGLVLTPWLIQDTEREVENMRIKRIMYAFPMSPLALDFNGGDGCWVVRLIDTVADTSDYIKRSFKTAKEAELYASEFPGKTEIKEVDRR